MYRLRGLAGWCAAIAISVAVLVGPAAGEAWAKGNKFGAWSMCSQLVAQSLKVPSRSRIAEYGGVGTSVFKSGNTYTVTAYVDTEDSLGADIHSGYVCTIRYTRRSYHLVYLQFA
jgi:hypothetical protein